MAPMLLSRRWPVSSTSFGRFRTPDRQEDAGVDHDAPQHEERAGDDGHHDPRVDGIAVYATSATTKHLQAAKRATTAATP